MPSLHRVLSLLTHCVLKPCVNRFAVSQQCYPLNQCPLQSPFPVQSPVKSHQAITLIPSLNSAPQQKTVKNKRKNVTKLKTSDASYTFFSFSQKMFIILLWTLRIYLE